MMTQSEDDRLTSGEDLFRALEAYPPGDKKFGSGPKLSRPFFAAAADTRGSKAPAAPPARPAPRSDGLTN